MSCSMWVNVNIMTNFRVTNLQKYMWSFVPNALTLTNLFFGCMAVYYLFMGEPIAVLICQIISNLVDFLDGWAARALKVDGELGKQLDSLADMVSFGLVPGLIMFFLLQMSCEEAPHWMCSWSYLPFIAFAITLSSAYRLGRFNIMESNVSGFIGLATPANTIFMLGLYLIVQGDMWEINEYLLNPLVLLIITGVFSYLLNSKWELFKIKLDGFKWVGYRRQWFLMILAIPAFIFLREGALAPLVLLYILLSLSRYFQVGR